MTGFLDKNKRIGGILLILLLLVIGVLSYMRISPWEISESAGTEFSPVKSSSGKTFDKWTEAAGTKGEVIYANLSPLGKPRDVHVVNVLNIGGSGRMTDYGEYSSISNLTDTGEITNENGEILIDSEPGVFYYQGNGGNHSLPWEISIEYLLNGEKLSPHDLAGSSGDFKMNIRVTPNEESESDYYDNYMLQISVPMDMNVFEQIDSEGGTEAISGGTKLINYSLLPGREGDFSVTAEVASLEMDGISISGIPFSMDFDMDEITSEFHALTGAVSDLDSGMNELDTGIEKLDSGVGKINKGSLALNKNLKKLNSATEELSTGSGKINDGLKAMASSLDSPQGSGDIADLIGGLKDMAGKLDEMSSGLKAMLDRLDVNAVSDSEFPAAEIGRVLNSGELNGTSIEGDVGAIIDYASKSAVFVGNYNAMSRSLKDVSEGMDTLSGHLNEAAKSLEPLKELSALQSGVVSLAGEYSTFHKGLDQYLDGVDRIAKAHNGLSRGLGKSSSGTRGLSAGAGELASGMGLFNESVQGIPGRMEDFTENMLGNSDYTPQSFVSPKNRNVTSVQFVMTTDKIVKPKKVKEDTEEGKGSETLWEKILKLFS